MLEKVKKYYFQFPDRGNFIPVGEKDGKIEYFYSDEEGLQKAYFLNFMLNSKGIYKKVEKEEILGLLEKSFEDIEDEESVQTLDEDEISTTDLDILSMSFEDAPIIKLVNQILISAIKHNASDIHFEGRDNFFEVRFRIDGRLRVFKKFPKSLQDTVIARIKVMAMLDVAESRRPQDGRINLKVGTKTVDIRVSIVPSITGEKGVLRILERSKSLITLEKVGMNKKQVDLYKKYIKSPNGIILVTGPTGSGKTTTLYASLLEIAREDINIMTVEDPVEYHLENITQVQVNPAVNITFANAIRSFLRQDPDVMLVGEIRDEETAEAAIQASLTGHLVLSTLHTNDAPGAVARLIDMDIEPFLISSTLMLVVAQRLVRKVCENCSEWVEPDELVKEMLSKYNIKLDKIRLGKGCNECFGSGYKGRIGIFEILEINDDIRKLINKKASADIIRSEATKKGFKTMFEYGFELVEQGITTPEEIIRTVKVE
jgi:general secretion pathway protein E